jgi:hypothetical protein
MDIILEPKNAKNIKCEICDFICCKMSNYTKHISTAKHKKKEKGYEYPPKNAETKKTENKCECGKEYNYTSGLWRHKKKCQIYKEKNMVKLLVKENDDYKSIILELVKNNGDLQKQMLDVCKNSNTIISNSNNKTFNLQLFLNEKCKDAMNIMEFVDTFQLQFSDLENVGKLGYVEGISEIIIKKLNEMDIYKRPIHCSDAKRDTLFIKDKDVWTKETGNHDKLRLAIRYITKKNTDMLNPWCESHPGSMNSENYLNDIYLNIVTQAMGGKGGIEENENKIIKKIAKTVFIDKI